jgi:GT2 family glycosyltransferase
MADQGTIGVVTVTYNSSTVIDEFMESLIAQTYSNYNLYVVDNNSRDDTLLKLKKYQNAPRIKLIVNSENEGVAKGNNQGITAAIADGCKYILLINNDTEFEDALIDKLLDGLTEYQCDLIVPKMLYHDNPNIIWCAGGHFLPWKAYLNVNEGKDEEDKGQYDEPRQIECAPTCCMLITLKPFETVGLMDEKYFVYYDDVDFSLRVLRAGFKTYYLPTARLTHKVSTLTGGVTSNFVLKYTTRNMVYYIRKNIAMPMSLFWITGLQLILLRRFIAGADSKEVYLLRQKALIEGLKM